MPRKPKSDQGLPPDTSPKDIHVKLAVLKQDVHDLWNQEDAAEKIRRKIMEFELECGASPTIDDDQLKRGMSVCKAILDQLPPSNPKVPDGLDSPASASRLTDHHPLIDESKGSNEVSVDTAAM